MNHNCQCKTGAECHCCVPRKRAPRPRKKDATSSQNTSQHDLVEPNGLPSAPSPRTPSHILARLAELRPVLPRPSIRSRSHSGPHDPSLDSAHGHSSVRRIHETTHFSPYGRAYEANHDHIDNIVADQEVSVSQNNFPIPSTPTFPTDEQTFRDQLRALEAAASTTWMPPSGAEGSTPSFPSTCGCGDNCRCPGCVEHNPDAATPASSAFSSCMSPNTCTNCLDCTILSLPASLPPDTSLSIYDAYQTDSIDDWIREVSSLPPINPPDDAMGPVPIVAEPDQPQWDDYPPNVVEPMPTDASFGYSVKPCCGVLCKCSPDTCDCDLEDESGYDCRREMLLPTFSTGRQAYPEDQPFQQLDNNDVRVVGFEPVRSRSESGAYFDAGLEPGRFFGFTEAPRSRSSSISTSSSQSQSSHSIPAPPQRHQNHHNGFQSQSMSQDCPWQPPGRVARGPFYAGQTSVSSPNLVLRLQTELNTSMSRGSSPSNVSPALSAPGSQNRNMHKAYAVSNSDSDGYASADDKMHWRD
ncbi:hypothetical protein DXG01_000574 [Tephrocybe rancida]|nr:hypothetical protein DXG01_000574 [Tephrocybe rancida]